MDAVCWKSKLILIFLLMGIHQIKSSDEISLLNKLAHPLSTTRELTSRFFNRPSSNNEHSVAPHIISSILANQSLRRHSTTPKYNVATILNQTSPTFCDCKPTNSAVVPVSTTSNPSPTTTTTTKAPSLTPETNTDLSTRIVNGTRAEYNQFPYLVSIGRAINNKYSNQSHYCGGTLINVNYILTAAHCLNDFKPKKILIGLGSTDKTKMKQIIEGGQITLHPEYSGWPHYLNDIALIKLKEPAKLNSNIKPACLHYNTLRFNGQLVAIGWGQLTYAGVYPKELQKVQLRFVKNADCALSWEKEEGHPPITTKHICAYNEFSDICGGDSGSPLITKSNGKEFILGVASFTNYCDKSQPAVYTRIYPYMHWIDSVVKEFCF